MYITWRRIRPDSQYQQEEKKLDLNQIFQEGRQPLFNTQMK